MSIKVSPVSSSVRPHVTITANSNALVGSADSTDKQLMLIGMARGGKPNEVYTITTLQQAKDIFRGGDLLDAIEVALTPDDTHHSGTILAERVGEATQATYKNKGLTLTSKAYSTDANDIQTSLVKNTLNGTYTLTVDFNMDNYSKTYTNLGKIMGIYYTGTQGYADVSVVTDVATDTANDKDKHTNQATQLVLKAGADKGSASVVHKFAIGSGKFSEIKDLITGINEIAGFNAVYFHIGNKNIETKYLDAVDSLELSKDSTNPTYLTSLGGDIVNAVNNIEDDSAISADYDPAGGEPDVYDFESLTGGTASEIAPESWVDSINNFTAKPGFYLVPLTSDIGVQTEAASFCSERNKEADPRAVIVGGGINDSMNASMKRSSLLRSREVRVAVNGVSGSRAMSDGSVRDLPAYIIAAQIGGLATGLNIGESITLKHLNLVDIDQKYTKAQLDTLNRNGVIGVEYTREQNNQVFRITNDITTAIILSEDPVETELATGEVVDYLVTGLRTELEQTFIGTSTTLSSAADIKTAVISYLQQEENNDIIQDYKESDIHVVVKAEAVKISITCVLTRTLKTIDVSLNFVDEELVA